MTPPILTSPQRMWLLHIYDCQEITVNRTVPKPIQNLTRLGMIVTNNTTYKGLSKKFSPQFTSKLTQQAKLFLTADLVSKLRQESTKLYGTPFP